MVFCGGGVIRIETKRRKLMMDDETQTSGLIIRLTGLNLKHVTHS
jgi:hypothetical protein